MSAIWAIGNNPRRKKRRSKRKLSAKQAQYFAPKKRRGKRRGRKAASHRRTRRSRSFGGVSTSGAMNFIKAGAVGGAGAVLVDVGMGYASRALVSAAPSLATPANADGTPNYGYYGVKAALALALGMMGGRLPVIGRFAAPMAEGALTVLAYQFMRPMVPASIALGYVNPAPTMRRVAGMAPGAVVGKYLPLGAYQSNVRSGGSSGAGSRAANVLNLRNR